MKDIQLILEEQRMFFKSGATKDISFRKIQLKKLKKIILENESEIIDALNRDLSKSTFEAYETEIGTVLGEIRFMLKNINRFSKPKRVKTPLAHFPSISKVYKEPYGVVLIMSPWNYPFQLTIGPLVGAIATGNCIIIRMSDYSPHTSEIIRKLLAESFERCYITVVNGGSEINQILLQQNFDYIFFTGSVSVGKLVMAEAAKHLTPVTLELGGKSPCIVDKTANVALAAKRITWGKFLNAGQTCVAPDYILVHKSIKKQLIHEIKINIREFYGNEPHKNNEYPKIISERHFKRLIDLMKSGVVVVGGQSNKLTNQIAPTILDNITLDSAIMQEEIFGPILPIIEFDCLKDAVSIINSIPKPLALYFFTTSKRDEKYIIDSIYFGGGCINDTIVHLGNPHMPFGGVGESGMGSYHGEASLQTFSHSKSILKKSNLLDIPLRYPICKNYLGILKKILR